MNLLSLLFRRAHYAVLWLDLATAAAAALADSGVASNAAIAVDPVTRGLGLPRKTVLVTGGAGFVGSHVADYLLGRGDSVVIVDEVNDYYDVAIKEGNLQMLRSRYGDGDEPPRLTVYRGDICNTTVLQTVFERHRFDAVCHMAARAGVRPSIRDPFVYLHSNIRGTVHLMEFATTHRVPNFVFASSSSVYGGSRSTFFSETERVDRPVSPYAATKRACELFSYVYQHQYGLNVTALRFFTVYGERGRPDMAPFKFIDRVSRGLTIQQFGDGTSSRDYTFIDDIVQGVVRAVDTPTPYKILNLGKGSGTVLKEFLSIVEKYVGKKAVVEVLPDQPGDVPYTCANITAAHEHLGYEATVPFEEGIQRTVSWYKEAYPDTVAAPQRHLRRRLKQILTSPSVGWTKDDDELLKDALRRVLTKDSTAFEDELAADSELFEVLLKAAAPISSRRLESSDTKVFPHTQPKKVLVTGGAGFLGSHVVDYLLERGDEVVLVDDKTREDPNLKFLIEKHGEEMLAIYTGDICDTEFLNRIFATEKPEWICHLASQTSTLDSLTDPVAFIRSDVESTVRLLEAAKGTDNESHYIRNFVMASSGEVYGRAAFKDEIDNNVYLHNEDDLVDYPKTPYAAGKQAGELLAHTYHHLYRFPITALRIFNVYGPRHNHDSESFQVIDALFDQRSAKITAKGVFTYVDDVVKAIASSLDRPYEYEIINIANNDCENSAEDFIAAASMAIGKRNSSSSVEKSPDGLPCANTSKAKQLLAFETSVTLDEGVQNTVEWHQKMFYPAFVLPSRSTSRPVDNRTTSTELETEDSEELEKTRPAAPEAAIQVFKSAVAVQERKPVDGESIFAHIPSWLRMLAFLQWFLVVTVLVARTFFKVSLGFGFSHRISPASSRSSSPVGYCLSQN